MVRSDVTPTIHPVRRSVVEASAVLISRMKNGRLMETKDQAKLPRNIEMVRELPPPARPADPGGGRQEARPRLPRLWSFRRGRRQRLIRARLDDARPVLAGRQRAAGASRPRERPRPGAGPAAPEPGGRGPRLSGSR